MSSLRRAASLLLSAFAPNRAAAWLMILAAVAESALLRRMSGNIFEVPGLTWVQVPLSLFFFWYCTVWALWWLLARSAAFSRRFPAAGFFVAAGIYSLLLVGVLLHLGGWAMYFSTGQFGSVEAIEFFARNAGESWLTDYILQSERWYVALAVGGLGLLAAALPRLTRIVRDGFAQESPPAAPRTLRRLRAGALLLLVVAWVGLGVLRRADGSVMNRGIWADAVERRLNPSVTLLLSGLRRTGSEKIEPVLDEKELTPLAAAPISTKLAADGPSIIFLAVESLRHDMVHLKFQGREVMPNLNRLAKNGVQFTKAYAQSTHSDYSDVCIVSSLYPLRSPRHHYYSSHDPWPKTLIYDLLKPAGYATAIFSSQNEKWGGMDQFLATPNLDVYYDAQRSSAPTRVDERDIGFAREHQAGNLRAGSLDDSHTTDQAVAWIDEQLKQKRRFFLNMNFQSSHFPYAMDPACPRPFQPCEFDFEASFLSYPIEKVPVVRNAYLNAVHECDRQLGRLIEALERADALDDVVFVVLGENGEAFYENGIVSHAGKPAEPAVHVALVVHAPQKLTPRVEDYPTELVDVVPTVLALCGAESHPNFQGRDVLAAARPPLEGRTLFFHTENPLSRADGLLHQGRWKFIRDRHTGVEELFDLQGDPQERLNLVAIERPLAKQLAATLTEWRARQLAYYHFPQYFQKFYPPRAPEVR